MMTIFENRPNLDKYNKSGEAIEFMELQLKNELYGDSILNPVYSCKPPSSLCIKPNHLKPQMHNMQIDNDKMHGYFTFKNVPSE